MRQVTAMSRPIARTAARGAVRVVAQGLVLVGLAMVVGCTDGEPDECAELRSALDELDGRFDAPDDEQSWDVTKDVAEATAERDRLRAELARAGCATDT